MLCELALAGNFITTWIALTVIGFSMIMLMSGTVFYKLYWNTTFKSWRWKSNPKYPTPEMVRSEVIDMMKGMASATFCPAMSLYLAQHNMSQAYCGIGEGNYAVTYLIISFFACWIISDFCEFLYHRLGHVTDRGWQQHKYHHFYFNPSPFAVIADEYVDQFFRALPMLVFPLVMPINIDMLFFQFGLFFYAYGVCLHTGFEIPFLDSHHTWINTPFQHYLHHAISIRNKPLHTGFFFKLWDQLFDSTYKGKCFCAQCSQRNGERTPEAFEKIQKIDYSPLISLKFWLSSFHVKGSN